MDLVAISGFDVKILHRKTIFGPNVCDSGQESFVVCVLNITASVAEDGRQHFLQYRVHNNVEGLSAWAMA